MSSRNGTGCWFVDSKHIHGNVQRQFNTNDKRRKYKQKTKMTFFNRMSSFLSDFCRGNYWKKSQITNLQKIIETRFRKCEKKLNLSFRWTWLKIRINYQKLIISRSQSTVLSPADMPILNIRNWFRFTRCFVILMISLILQPPSKSPFTNFGATLDYKKTITYLDHSFAPWT